jgi:hypothetical protein
MHSLPTMAQLQAVNLPALAAAGIARKQEAAMARSAATSASPGSGRPRGWPGRAPAGNRPARLPSRRAAPRASSRSTLRPGASGARPSPSVAPWAPGARRRRRGWRGRAANGRGGIGTSWGAEEPPDRHTAGAGGPRPRGSAGAAGRACRRRWTWTSGRAVTPPTTTNRSTEEKGERQCSVPQRWSNSRS